jgi:hypothetical protein
MPFSGFRGSRRIGRGGTIVIIGADSSSDQARVRRELEREKEEIEET